MSERRKRQATEMGWWAGVCVGGGGGKNIQAEGVVHAKNSACSGSRKKVTKREGYGNRGEIS